MNVVSVIFVFRILFELWPAAAAGIVLCPIPALKNGRAKIQMRGRSVKFKCFRSYTLIGKRALTITAQIENKRFQNKFLGNQFKHFWGF